MSDNNWNPAIRRAYPRYEASVDVEIREVGGEAAIEGTTLNVSRGGALVRTDVQLIAGGRYVVQIHEDTRIGREASTCPNCGSEWPGKLLPRQSRLARALRVGHGAGSSFAVALEFERLLEIEELTEEPDDEAAQLHSHAKAS